MATSERINEISLHEILQENVISNLPVSHLTDARFKNTNQPPDTTVEVKKCSPVILLKDLKKSTLQNTSSEKNGFRNSYNQDSMIGTSFSMDRLKKYLSRIAATDSTVLITGETGTGKELTAQIIYNLSKRKNKPFIPVNCAALPENLLESELFGYEKGAFTGAYTSSPGKLKLAENGTIFFDEIGELSLNAQAKILRVLDTKEFFPVGGKKSIPVDVRIITATNRDLEALVSQGKFREDLYYRLNVARVEIPPLRERKEDIPLILINTIQQFNRQFSMNVIGLTEEVYKILIYFDWPGNIRELKNILEAVFITLSSSVISLNDLPSHFRKKLESSDHTSQNERDRLISALSITNWNKSQAAQKLNWSRNTLYRKMSKHKIANNKN